MAHERIDPGLIEKAVLAEPAALPPILETTFHNPAHDASDPNWAGALCSNATWLGSDPPKYEWTQVLDPASQYESDLVGLSGTGLLPKVSDRDVWFTHPFGFDWEFFIAPDDPYMGTLAPSNASASGEYGDAIAHARNDLGLAVGSGVLGVESDQDLIPPAYRVQDGDRVAVFGRWIVDCGHGDFHTEIHPPLLVATARAQQVTTSTGAAGPLDGTFCSLIGRPFLVGQEFGDGALRGHLINEILKAETFRSARLEAHPQLLPKPFDGLFLIPLTIRPPSPRRSPRDRLVVSYQFTVRSGIVLQVFNGGDDGVGVMISMNSIAYTAPSLPQKNDWSISINDIRQENSDAGGLIVWLATINALLNPLADAVLARGVLTDRYAALNAGDPSGGAITKEYVQDLSGNSNLAVDDSQVFPIQGWVQVEWERHPALPTADLSERVRTAE
jgi:hypothetical protein